MKMKKYLVAFIAIILVGMVSCTQIGPTGPAGRDGIDGADGTDGTNGSTPLVYYFDIQLNDFIYESYNESWNAYAHINDFTIIMTDLVMVFVNLNSDGGDGDNYWQAMPYSEFITDSIFIQHSFGIMDINDDSGNNNYLKGDIMFSLRASDGLAPYNDMNSTALLLYNVYIIEGQEGKKAQLPDYVDPNDRDQVKKYVEGLKK